MVRVWYEPPPYGPGTDLNRSGYGVHGGGTVFMRRFLERMSKMPQLVAIGVPTAAILVICYIPLSAYSFVDTCGLLGFVFVCAL